MRARDLSRAYTAHQMKCRYCILVPIGFTDGLCPIAQALLEISGHDVKSARVLLEMSPLGLAAMKLAGAPGFDPTLPALVH